jgi:radical SAM superfamily enzyme YgiQ (UPF0313 family)
MRAPGEVLLVSCYELGHQPLGLASPLACLQREGYSPAAVDTSVETLSDAAIGDARLVAISVPMHTALRLGARVAERVRRVNPAAHVCMYGLYATLNSERLLATCADSVLGGEFERPLVELVAAVERGDRPQPSPPPHIARIPFEVPDRRQLPPLERYAHLERDGEALLAGHVEASRGCLHTCRHCPITPVYGGRFFVVPPEVVLEDIRRQVAMGARHITFGDPDFLNGPGHSLRIVRAMREEFPDVTFDATIKIEHILERRAVFPELGQLGCAFVLSAVESLDDRVLGRLHKGHTRADVFDALDILDAAGVPMRPSLLPFTPWETLEGYADMLDTFEARGMLRHVAPVQLTIRLLVPPGSPLAEELERDGTRGPLDADAYSYRWEHPDPRMDRLQREVAALVEGAESSGEDPARTFHHIKARAHALLGRPAPRASVAATSQGHAPPRLTEAWFC